MALDKQGHAALSHSQLIDHHRGTNGIKKRALSELAVYTPSVMTA
jgi:hypothetical protein